MQPHPITVIADANVPGLEPIEADNRFTLKRMSAPEMTPEAVAEADALIVRTRTRCDANLLSGSRVQFVGTATIGLDHIDSEWCAANGIEAVNAPGCNAPAVAQYVLTAIMTLHPDTWQDMTLGIVGVGHVGSIVDRWARSLGIKTMLCDPPRAERGDAGKFVSLDTLLGHADVITLHTPLTSTGKYPTINMIGTDQVTRIKPGATIINAARGGIIDEQALLHSDRPGKIVIDTWAGEPDGINTRLFERTSIHTPHIAGYSAEGKSRATLQVLTSLYNHFGLEPATLGALDPIADSVTPDRIASYDIMADNLTDPGDFERSRNTYRLRPEPAPSDRHWYLCRQKNCIFIS